VNDPFREKWGRFKKAWRDITTYDLWDGVFRIRMGLRAQADATLERTDETVEEIVGQAGDSLEFRRVRLFAAGLLFRHLKFKFSYDFAVDAGLKDAYIENAGRLSQYAFIRLGFFKEPVSFQRLTSGMDSGFLEWGLPVSTFAPGRSLGAMVHHPELSGRMTWAAGFFTIGSTADDNTGRSNLTIDARVTGLPLDRKNGSRLIHLGASFSVRRPKNDSVRYRTRPEARFLPFFLDTGDLSTDDDTTLLGAELAAVSGPFWAQAEVLTAHVAAADLNDPRLTGSYLELGWFLSGEVRPYNHQRGVFDHVEPVKHFKGRNPFNLKRPGGALELTGRFSAVDLNDGLVTGGELRNLSAGMNWYLNAQNRVSVNYIHAKLLDVGKSNIVLFRYQYTPRP
jgi:phosphate-selective porin OprO/OprP